MGVLARIFGAGDVVKAGFELIDSMHTSGEEEIAAKSKAKTDLLTAYAPFKLAQRYLALMYSGTFLICFFIVLICALAGIGNTEEIYKIMEAFKIGWIALTIVGFYFSGGVIDSVMTGKK